MLDLVIAMCSILLHIRHQQKCDGPACVWQVGHVLIVNATSSHLVPKTGFVKAGHSCVHHLRVTRALVAVQLIFRSTTGLCLQIGLLVVVRIGSVRDSDAAVNVAQAQQCHYKGHEVQNEMCACICFVGSLCAKGRLLENRKSCGGRVATHCFLFWCVLIYLFCLAQQVLSIKCLIRAKQVMLHHYLVALLSFAAVVSSRSVQAGMASRFSGTAVARSDFILNLQPPQETTRDIEASLDAIMKAEDEKRVLSDDEFESAKQSMINVEKQRIRDIVQHAFAAKA